MANIANLSVNNVEMTITIGMIPIRITHLSADADFWVNAGTSTLGGSARTPDGKLLIWGMNGLLKKTLTLSAASPAAHAIINAFQAQMRNGEVKAVLIPINVITKTETLLETCTTGIIEDGYTSFDFGKEHLLELSWTFSFDKIITTPLSL